ncbi:MAG: phosphomannomutase/phosphoglucomutase [Planctomycetota bacterium]|nr:phosphomannomutase/phosphoglucomutase [Planctomycetota bacterium]
MLGRIFKAYDVRGTYPDLLNETLAWQIGYGASKFLLADAAAAGETTPMMKNIVVGRDMRTHSPSLAKALIQGIRDHGGDVIDVGMVDTSFIYFAVNHLDCAGGIQVTASHNPPNYNGFKFSKRRAKPVGETSGLAEVRKHAAMVDKATLQPAAGRVEVRDLWAAYTKHVRHFLNMPSGKKLKVVIDASNGMAGTMIPKIFGKESSMGAAAGLEIIPLHFENTKGVFVHEPNPLVASNMKWTQDAVLKHKADIGFCYDGDADRCFAVDEKGNIVGCDHLTVLMGKYFLKENPGASIAYDLRSTKAVEEDITKAGGKAVRGKVGHVNMKAALADQKCVFGGELSGHFYFRDNYNADSGAIAMCVILSILAQGNKTLSELIKPIARYAQSGEINFNIEDKDGAIAAIKKEFGGAPWNAKIDEMDGVTIDCFAAKGEHGGWWANIRKSNTEPLLRLNAEARDKATLDRIVAMLSPKLGHKVDH